MSARTFNHGSFQLGGKPVRGVTIKCSRCAAERSIPMVVHDTKPRDQDAKLARLATRKFEGFGWLVGRNETHDLCPACRAPKPAPQPQKHPTLTLVEKPTMQTAAVTKSPSEQPPRAMGIDDALLIASKLNEVYLGKDKGYADDWTDGKVAEGLGTPRAWVKEVRVKSYGDGLAGNDEITALVRDAQKVRNDAVGVLERLESAKIGVIDLIHREIAPLRAVLDRVDSKLAAVARAMQ